MSSYNVTATCVSGIFGREKQADRCMRDATHQQAAYSSEAARRGGAKDDDLAARKAQAVVACRRAVGIAVLEGKDRRVVHLGGSGERGRCLVGMARALLRTFRFWPCVAVKSFWRAWRGVRGAGTAMGEGWRAAGVVQVEVGACVVRHLSGVAAFPWR